MPAMNQIDLKDRVAVRTGGAGGLGLAIAERMVASGAVVTLWDIKGTPAAIDTDLLEQMTAEQIAYVTAKIPLGRLGVVSQIISPAIFQIRSGDTG